MKIYRYIAFLRAINVGGNSVIKMADLAKAFDAHGLTEVKTHIQTGNVVFTSLEKDVDELARQLEKRFEPRFKYHIGVFVLTPAELKKAAANNPFDPEEHDATRRCHLVFLSAEPTADRIKALKAMEGDEYSFAVKGKVLYYAYDRKWDGKRRTVNFEKVLGVSGTARTWKVVEKLIEIAEGK